MNLKIFKKPKPSRKRELKRLYRKLETLEIGCEDYRTTVEIIDGMEKMKTYEKESKRDPLNINNVLLVAGNLACVVMVLKFEKTEIFTSKALGVILKR